MNPYLVATFREKLCRLNISDYHGLKSPGLTCYLNCILQVLFMTKDFREAVKRCSRKDSTTFDSHLDDLFAVLEKKMAETHEIIRKLGIANVFEQRDAAEYFEKILCWTSPEASKMFKGELNHRTKCLKCKETNDSRSFFWLLPLVVEDFRHHVFSVEEGLKAFFKGEKICGENKIFCDHCQEKQDEEFECQITQSPAILTLLLKRFSYDYVCSRYIKLHCKVAIPKTLHMTDCTYDLYAVVNHFGELTGGHYTAQIKSFETHCWYNFNDESVRVNHEEFKAEDKSLKSRTAYLLMYRKVDEHLEKCDDGDGDVDVFCTNVDVEAKEKLHEAQRQMDKSIPKVNFKQLNGEISTEIHGDVLKKMTNFSESPENLFHRRAPHQEVIQRDGAQNDPELNRWHLGVNTQTPSGHSASSFQKCLLENKHETEKTCLMLKNTDCETQISTAVKTVLRKPDVTLTRSRVQTAKSQSVKNKTDDDISQKMAGTMTKRESRPSKSREPWR